MINSLGLNKTYFFFLFWSFLFVTNLANNSNIQYLTLLYTTLWSHELQWISVNHLLPNVITWAAIISVNHLQLDNVHENECRALVLKGQPQSFWTSMNVGPRWWNANPQSFCRALVVKGQPQSFWITTCPLIRTCHNYHLFVVNQLTHLRISRLLTPKFI